MNLPFNFHALLLIFYFKDVFNLVAVVCCQRSRRKESRLKKKAMRKLVKEPRCRTCVTKSGDQLSGFSMEGAY